MKHNRKREAKKERVSISLLERIQPDAAGIDCGQNSHFVAADPLKQPGKRALPGRRHGYRAAGQRVSIGLEGSAVICRSAQWW